MNKTARENAGIRLLPDALAKLDAAAKRLGVSRSAVVEALIRLCADHVKPPSLDPAIFPADHRGTRGQGRRPKPAAG